MSYTLNDNQIALLQRIAGGFNRNRVGVALADRFVASVKWANAEDLNTLLDTFSATPPVAPEGVVTPSGPISAFDTLSLAGSPHTVYAILAGTDGRFSVEISGSPFVTFATGVKGAFDPARTTEGAGTGTPQAVKAGEWCNWKYDAVSGGQTMRPQLL